MNAKLTTIITLSVLGLGSMTQPASASDLSRFLERTGIIRNNNTATYQNYGNYGHGTAYRHQYVYQGGGGYSQHGNSYAAPQYPQYGQPPLPQSYLQPQMPLPPVMTGPNRGVGYDRCHCGHCDQCCHHHHEGPVNHGNRNRGWYN